MNRKTLLIVVPLVLLAGAFAWFHAWMQKERRWEAYTQIALRVERANKYPGEELTTNTLGIVTCRDPLLYVDPVTNRVWHVGFDGDNDAGKAVTRAQLTQYLRSGKIPDGDVPGWIPNQP